MSLVNCTTGLHEGKSWFERKTQALPVLCRQKAIMLVRNIYSVEQAKLQRPSMARIFTEVFCKMHLIVFTTAFIGIHARIIENQQPIYADNIHDKQSRRGWLILHSCLYGLCLFGIYINTLKLSISLTSLHYINTQNQ